MPVPEIEIKSYSGPEAPEPPRDYLEFDNFIIKRGKMAGRCNVCGLLTVFELRAEVLREDLPCRNCQSFNRIRQLVLGLAYAEGIKITPYLTLEQILARFKRPVRILLLEVVTHIASVFDYLVSLHPIELYKSEFISTSMKSGEWRDGVMHLDIMDSGFEDNYFDLIIHADVFEHVSDAVQGEKEQFRILRPGGAIVYTAPTYDRLEHDDVRTTLKKDGSLNKLKKPIYHGDPSPGDLGEAGAIVFRFFSYTDVRQRYLDMGADYTCLKIYAPAYGIIGQDNHVHVVKKSKRKH